MNNAHKEWSFSTSSLFVSNVTCTGYLLGLPSGLPGEVGPEGLPGWSAWQFLPDSGKLYKVLKYYIGIVHCNIE